jgi:hypothetical protein
MISVKSELDRDIIRATARKFPWFSAGQRAGGRWQSPRVMPLLDQLGVQQSASTPNSEVETSTGVQQRVVQQRRPACRLDKSTRTGGVPSGPDWQRWHL